MEVPALGAGSRWFESTHPDLTGRLSLEGDGIPISFPLLYILSVIDQLST